MKAYIIVRGGTFEDLQEKVGELITEGYTPVGSPSIMMSNYIQAVYLKKISEMFEQQAPLKSIIKKGPLVGSDVGKSSMEGKESG